MPLTLFVEFLAGAIMVIVGMTLFLVGIETGIIPMGEVVGSELPKRRSILLIIAIVFLIGSY